MNIFTRLNLKSKLSKKINLISDLVVVKDSSKTVLYLYSFLHSGANVVITNTYQVLSNNIIIIPCPPNQNQINLKYCY